MEDRSTSEVLASMLKGSLRTQILGPGAVSDRERELLDAIVANPTVIFSLDKSNKARLDTLLETINDNRDNKAKFYGVTAPENQLKKQVGFTASK